MLNYIGDGTALIGVPARDLSDAEVAEAGGEAVLIATGLYQKPTPPTKTGKGQSNALPLQEKEVKNAN